MCKKLLILLVFLLGNTVLGLAQFNITATEVERWITEDMPPSDYNLNSAYVYLVNGNTLKEVFVGEGLNRSQRRQLDLKKGDYPQYMYLAVNIENPMKEGEDLTIPLMIHDVQEPATQSRVAHYGGRFLENIPDEMLKNGDIVAKVKFEAIKGNSSSEFWKKTAEISINLGKTATNLLASPLTGTFATLSQQIIPHLDSGMKSMENVEDPAKMSSEFYIRLISKELSALYQEKVVSATLYRIHWDIDTPAKSRFFRKGSAENVEDVKRMVTHTQSPFILVVNTKAEYNTDHSELAYNQTYIERKSRDYRKIRNVEKREIEKEFLETMKTAVELKSKVQEFQSSLNTKYPDWHAYSRMIDLYYDLRSIQQGQMLRVQGMEPFIQEKYSRLYTNVQNDVDLWFTTELLDKGRDIAAYLAEHRVPYAEEARTKSVNEVYEDIQLLDFFRNRARQTEIQGKLPKEIESLESFQLALRKLREMENVLFEKAFDVDNRLSPEMQKSWLMERATKFYPLCQVCNKRVGDEITRIENKTHEENLRKYQSISASYYAKLECFDKVFTSVDYIIKSNQDSLTMSPFMLEALKQDRAELLTLSSSYMEFFGKDYQNMAPGELADLLSGYELTRQKMAGLVRRLRTKVPVDSDLPCLMEDQVRP